MHRCLSVLSTDKQASLKSPVFRAFLLLVFFSGSASTAGLKQSKLDMRNACL